MIFCDVKKCEELCNAIKQRKERLVEFGNNLLKEEKEAEAKENWKLADQILSEFIIIDSKARELSELIDICESD